MPPLIGIPCYHDKSSGYDHSPVNAQNDAYLSAILQAGGTLCQDLPTKKPAATLHNYVYNSNRSPPGVRPELKLVTVHPPRSIAPCGRAQGPMLHFLVRGGERLLKLRANTGESILKYAISVKTPILSRF